MRTFSLLSAVALVLAAFAVGRTRAHEEMIGPLVVIEKVYDAPEPLGRIVVRYDATEAEPTLHLRHGRMIAKVPADALRDLPRPNWDAMTVPYAMTSFDVKTRAWVDRPYFYISVPLHGPAGKTWPTTAALFFFDKAGRLSERKLKQFMPIKDGRPRPDLPPGEADVIDAINEDWPAGGVESAEDLLRRVVKERHPEADEGGR
jgi:hypothetical protein